MEIFSFVVNHKKVIISCFFAVLIISITTILGSANKSNNIESPTPQPTPVVAASGAWGNLNDIVGKMEETASSSATTNKDGIYFYKSNNEGIPNKVIYKENTPIFLKESVTSKDNKTANSITQKFGREELVLFGELSNLGFNLYAYPSKGIAYLGNKEQGTLLEIWYFTPTTVDQFTKDWANGYSGKQIEQGF